MTGDRRQAKVSKETGFVHKFFVSAFGFACQGSKCERLLFNDNKMRDFKTIETWKKAHILTLKVYKITKGFPREELYGLTSQLRRACSSVPTNIAEGGGRETDKEFVRFLHISRGSACETEYLLMLSRDLNYLNETQYEDLSSNIIEIKRMLTGFINKLKDR